MELNYKKNKKKEKDYFERNLKSKSLKKDFFDKVLFINRCSKVVKGGRRFSFSALIVSGNKKGLIGIGLGKSKEIPDAIRKGIEKARKNIKFFNLSKKTILYNTYGKFKGVKVSLFPARNGNGIIANSNIKSILNILGIEDILSKSHGSKNKKSNISATLKALSELRTSRNINQIRKKNKIFKHGTLRHT